MTVAVKELVALAEDLSFVRRSILGLSQQHVTLAPADRMPSYDLH